MQALDKAIPDFQLNLMRYATAMVRKIMNDRILFKISESMKKCKISNYNTCNIYRPQRSCGQGYVFTRVCDSVHGGGLRRTPPGPGRPPRTKEKPRDQADPPPPGPRRTPPGPGRPPPQGEPPPDQADTPPERRLQHTVNERPVRILLECILVTI